MNPRVMVKQSVAMVTTNIAQCQDISLFVSKLTCDSLMSKIQETMPAEEAGLFKKSNEPFIDIYGRSTFVYIQFLDKSIPVLQPGSLRIESGVTFDSSLAVFDQLTHLNAFLLQRNSSLFICRFLAQFVRNYTRVTQTIKTKPLLSTLETAIRNFLVEDITKHCCLVELKDTLSRLTEDQLTPTILSLLHSVDFKLLREIENETEVVSSIKMTIPTADEIAKVMDLRHKDSAFSIKDHYVDGSKFLAEKLDTIVDELGNSEDLVQPDKVADFKIQLEEFKKKSANTLTQQENLGKIKSLNPQGARSTSPTSQVTIHSAPETVTTTKADTLQRRTTASEYKPRRPTQPVHEERYFSQGVNIQSNANDQDSLNLPSYSEEGPQGKQEQARTYTQAQIDDKFIENLDKQRKLYYALIKKELNLTFGLTANGKEAQSDSSWVNDTYAKIVRWRSKIKDFEIVILQNKIEEKRSLIQLKAIPRQIKDLKVRTYITESLSNRLTILRRDHLAESSFSEQASAEQEQQMKITQRATFQENRADLDAKLIYLVLAQADSLSQIEKLISEAKFKELIDFIVMKFIEAAESYRGKVGTINQRPVQESEIKLIPIAEIIESGSDISGRKINIPEHFFDPDKEFHVAQSVKQMPQESDEAHAKRVKAWLIHLKNEEIVKLGHLIDNQDPDQANFFILYTQVQSQRAEGQIPSLMRQNTTSRACSIF